MSHFIDYKATGENISKLMEKYHVTPTELAEMLDISTQAVYYYKRGKKIPNLSHFYAISCIFQTPMEEIVVTKGIPQFLEKQAHLSE
jgi:DNA-binding XRE family transcriptional regulator